MIVKDNILLSFPRSGNGWVRYTLEFVSKRPTSICLVRHAAQEGFIPKDAIGAEIDIGVDLTQHCIAIKRHRADHNWDNFTPDNSRIILLVRSYKEAIIRHLLTKKSQDNNFLLKYVKEYQHCIEFFHRFKGEKILLYYEDLMLDDYEFQKLFDFLGISTLYINAFFKDIKKHRLQSINCYKPGSMTRGDKYKLNFYSKRFQSSAEKIEKHMRQFHLYKKYLSRYA